MDRRLTGIYVLMRELVGGFRIEELEERVFVQKAIYLLQVLGIDLRFRFSWYLRGPYSTDLTQCVFEINGDKKLQERAESYSLRREVVPGVDRLRGILEAKPEVLDPPDWLELLSSIHYLKHISKADISQDSVGDVLRDVGKEKFSDDQANAAWEELAATGLIDRKVIPLKE